MSTYNFYNLLTLRCDFGGHRGYIRYFNNEYRRIAKGDSDSTAQTITLRTVQTLPVQESGDVIKTIKYKKLFSYHFLVRGLDTPQVEIFFKRHWIDRLYMNAIGVFVQAQVLEPIMYLKLLEQNVLFMHAGGVCKDGKGYLLPAYGGTGKTTFSIALTNHGFKLLGDDLLLVDINKKLVHPYPRPLHLFTYNIRNLNGAHVPFRYSVFIYSKNVLRWLLEKILHTEFLISTRVHIDEIFPGDMIGETVPYAGVFFLRKTGEAAEAVAITTKNAAQLAEGIMESEDLNDSLYTMLDGQPKLIANIKNLEQTIIAGLLQQLPQLVYVNTRKLDLANLDDFITEYMH